MPILKIARMGHPVLLREAEPVDDPTHPDIRRLIADMVETMQDASGIGLAAPQVHVPLRLFVWRGTAGVSALVTRRWSRWGRRSRAPGRGACPSPACAAASPDRSGSVSAASMPRATRWRARRRA